MVRAILKLINREVSGLHEAAYLLGAFAFLSQLLALVRDRLLAHTFGAGHALDIYYASFRIPDFIFVAIASMVSLTVLIPFLIEKLDRSEKEAKEFINSIFTLFFFLMAAVSVLAYVFAPNLLNVFFPAYSQDHGTLTYMTRVMLLSPIFLGFSNFLASITQIYKRYFIYALSPIVYNVGIIAGIVVFYPKLGIAGLAWGVALGAFLHCFIQVPFVVGKSLFPRLSLQGDIRQVYKVLLVSLPRTLALSSNEIAKFFLIILAAGLAGGAVSVFNLALNLQSVPLTIIGVSYSVAAFPALARLYSSGQKDHFLDQMILSSKHIIFWTVPLAALFVVFRAHIVRIILGSGEFSWSDTRLTAAALALFVVSLVPQSMTLLFVRSYYARGSTKKPLIFNLLSAALIILSSYVLMRAVGTYPHIRGALEALLRVRDVPGTEVLILPLGFSFGVFINLIIHWAAFELDFRGYTRKLARTIFDVLVAAGIMGGCGYLWLGMLSEVFLQTTFWGIFLQAGVAGLISVLVGAGILFLLQNAELIDIVRTLHRKIWRAKVIPPDNPPV